jgi:ferrous iron transport protein B
MSSATSSTPGQSPFPADLPRQDNSGSLRPDGVNQIQQKSGPPQAQYIVLTGNPNCGKTTLFNALTGLRAKVGNYAGVTVERKEGRLLGAPAGVNVRVLDLPGTYSLSPQSLDEQISRDVLLNRLPELPAPSLVVVVVDASNLQRNLYYTTQVIELGYPTVIALNMMDVARNNGHQLEPEKLARELGVPVFPLVASDGQGVSKLTEGLRTSLRSLQPGLPREFYELPDALRREVATLAAGLARLPGNSRVRPAAEALLLLGNEKALDSSSNHYSAQIQDEVRAARQRLDAAGVDWRGSVIEGRYLTIAGSKKWSPPRPEATVRL